MKKICFFIFFIVFSIIVNAQILGKTKGFQQVYKVNANFSVDSIETILLDSFQDTTINDFFTDLSVDTITIEKKFRLDYGIYIFLSKYEDSKFLIAPYESTFVDMRFSRIARWMVFVMNIKKAQTDDEYNLEYGEDVLKLY